METTEETEYCANCARNIPAGNFQVHQLHCVRNIITCKICNEPIAKALEESHFQEYHVKIKCSQCNQVMQKCNMEDHQKYSCSHRLRICHFCEIEIKANQFDNHIKFCGARTDSCPNCKQLVMLKDTENHQIICSQGGITDSLNKISKGSSRDRSQRQNDNGSHHRTNIDDKIENFDQARIYQATKSNKNDETKKRNFTNKSVSIDSNNVDNLLSGTTPLDSVIRRYFMNDEADSEADIVISPSSKASRNSSISTFNSGFQPISDNLKQHVTNQNGNLHLENNRVRKTMHNNKLPLSNQYSDSIRKQREDRNTTQHSSSTPELPKLRYGAYKTKADTLISNRHESLKVSNSSNGNQESTNVTSAPAYLANYSRHINDQTNIGIDVQKIASFNDEKFSHQRDRKDLSGKIYFQDTKSTTNSQATSYGTTDNGTFKNDQSELDHEFAAALQLQLNENVVEHQVDPRSSNRSGSSVNVLDHMEIPVTSLSSTVHTSKASQSGSSMANVQEQLDWECAMKLHEQLNVRSPRLEPENIEGHNAMPMDEEFDTQFQLHEQLNAQNFEMKPEDVASSNTMQADESYAMRLHEQLNARSREFDSKLIKDDTALQYDEEYAMQLYEQLNARRPELTIGSNDVDERKNISNFKTSSDPSSNTIKDNSATISDREWSRQECEKLIDDAFKTPIDFSNDETRKFSKQSTIATAHDHENLPYTSSPSKYNNYRLQTTSEEFQSYNSTETFDDDKGGDILRFQSQVENADVAQNNDNTSIPCEFCGKLYPARQFKDHEELCYRTHYQFIENSRFSNSAFGLPGNTDFTAKIDSLDSLPIAHISSKFQDESSTDSTNNGTEEDRRRHQFRSAASNDEGQRSICPKDINKGTLDRQQNFTKISNDKKKSKSSRGSRSQKKDETYVKAKFTDMEQNRIADTTEDHRDVNHLMPRNSKISARLGASSQLDESRTLFNRGLSNDSYKKISSSRLQNSAQSIPTAKSKDYKTVISSGRNESIFRNVSTERDARHDGMTAKGDFRSTVPGEHRQSEVTSRDRSPKRSSKVKQSPLWNGNVSNYSHNSAKTSDCIRGAGEPYEDGFHFNDVIDGSGLSGSHRRISQDLPSSHKTGDRISSDELNESSKRRKAARKVPSDYKRKG